MGNHSWKCGRYLPARLVVYLQWIASSDQAPWRRYRNFFRFEHSLMSDQLHT